MECVAVRPRFVWGVGDTVLVPRFIRMMREGKWKWVDGGRWLTSTCHVQNLCEGLLLAALRGKPNQVYFLTDGPALPARQIVSDIVQANGCKAPGEEASVPFWLAFAGAFILEQIYAIGRACCCSRSYPEITRQGIILFGRDISVSDAKARRELGYTSHVSVQQGLQEMAEAHASQSKVA